MIAVIGGAGYIGSHAVRELQKQGYKVLVIDNLQTGHREAVEPSIPFCKGDIRDLDFLNQVFSEFKIEAIIHFAANSLVGESVQQPLKYFNNNVHGTEVLLEAMRMNEIKHIVFSSSAAVYGEVNKALIDENDATNPTSPYGETKLAMERMMRWCDDAYGMKFISLRYFNVAGADEVGDIGEDHNPETHLIPLILQVPLGKREQIKIFGDDYPTQDGTCIRDYLHVTDLAKAHIKALEYLKANNQSNIFNLGIGNGFSVLEMIEAARRVTKHPIPQEVVERRAGDPASLVASPKKANEVLGWQAEFTNVEDIIESAWRWHQNRPDGF